MSSDKSNKEPLSARLNNHISIIVGVLAILFFITGYQTLPEMMNRENKSIDGLASSATTSVIENENVASPTVYTSDAILLPTPTPNLSPTGTATLVLTEAPTPTPMPTPLPTSTIVVQMTCPIAVDTALLNSWQVERIGCPTGQAHLAWAAWQPFVGGHLIWRQDTNAAYVFAQSGWYIVMERWDDVSSGPSRGDPPPGLQAPTRGFGYVWSINERIFRDLGWATTNEQGFCAWVQEFEQGFLLRSNSAPSCYDNLANNAANSGWPLQQLNAYANGVWE